jgi:hypothetical protein
VDQKTCCMPSLTLVSPIVLALCILLVDMTRLVRAEEIPGRCVENCLLPVPAAPPVTGPPEHPGAPSQAAGEEREKKRRRTLHSYNSKGIEAAKNGDYRAAHGYFKEALKYSPHNPTILRSIEIACIGEKGVDLKTGMNKCVATTHSCLTKADLDSKAATCMATAFFIPALNANEVAVAIARGASPPATSVLLIKLGMAGTHCALQARAIEKAMIACEEEAGNCRTVELNRHTAGVAGCKK